MSRDVISRSAVDTGKKIAVQRMMLLIFSLVCFIELSGCATPQPKVSDGPRRFALTPLADMSEAQRAVAIAIMTGPRAAAGSPAAAAGATSLSSPFNVWIRRPELANHLQQLGEYIRFRSSLPKRLNEFAILILAQKWNAQYEWFAHHRLAMAAGLDPVVADDLANGKMPSAMQADEKIIYAFTTELLDQHHVSDATYQLALASFGEEGIADLIAVDGYYTLVSMTLNVDRTPVPSGAGSRLPNALK